MTKLIVLHGWELSENVACYRHLYLLINMYYLNLKMEINRLWCLFEQRMAYF